MQNVIHVDMPFAAGAALSDPWPTENASLLQLWVPLGFTGTQLTLQLSRDGTTWFDAYDRTGAELVLTVAAGRVTVLDAGLGLTFGRFLRLRSGTGAAPAAQASAVTPVFYARHFG